MRTTFILMLAITLLAIGVRPVVAAPRPVYLHTLDGMLMVWAGSTGTVKFAQDHASGSGTSLNLGAGAPVYVTESTGEVCRAVGGILYPRKGGGLACAGAVHHLYLMQEEGYGTRIASTFGGHVSVDADPNTVAVQFGAVAE